MKANSLYIVIIGALLLLTFSCTIEKRVHQKGFHFAWKNQNKLLVQKSYDTSISNISKEQNQEDFNSNTIIQALNQNQDYDYQEDNASSKTIQLPTSELEKMESPLIDTVSTSIKKDEKEVTPKKEPVGQIALALIFGLFFTAGKLYSLFIFLPVFVFLIIIILLIIHRIRIKKFPEKYKNPNSSIKPKKIRNKKEVEIYDGIIAKPLLLIGLIALILGLLLTLAIFIFNITAMPFIAIAGSLVALSFLLLYVLKFVNRHSTFNATYFTLISFLAVIFWLLFITQSGFIILILIPLIGIFLLPRLITKLYD